MMTVKRPDGSGADGPDGVRLGRFVPLVVLALGLAAFYLLDLDRFFSLEALKEHRAALVGWVDGVGWIAGLAYALAYAVVVAFSLPGAALMTIVSGFLFGPWLGTLWAVAGATAGATAVFLAARYAFADLVRARAGAAVRRMEAGFRRDALSYILVLRLIPLFPFWLVNLVPALLNVRLGVYVLGTFLGIIPGGFVFALVGNGLGAVLDEGGALDLAILTDVRFIAPIAGLALLALVPVVYRWLKDRQRP